MTQTRTTPVLRPTTRLARVALSAIVLVGFATTTAAQHPVDASPAGAATHLVAGSDGWETATPASMGMDATTLDQARTYAFTPERHTQGVVVVRGGKIVDEWYAPGEGPDSWAASWSVGKSFASTLVGIAIAQGKIPSVDEPMTTYFPEWSGTPKAAITLRDVLHMESGLQWNEDYDVADVASSDVISLGLSSNELAYAASRPLAHPPGTVFNYSSGDAMLLSGVLAKATGMPAGDYAKQVLYGPLGIGQVENWTDANGHTLTYCCTDTTSRDFARLGLLFLRGGDWNGTQVVPASWVHDATQPTSTSGGIYGYMWWITSMPEVQGPIYNAIGFDGQYIFVIPSLDLVVVRNGDYVKSACPPVADPVLFGRYPPSGLSPTAGTRPPESWSNDDFLRPIVQSVTGPESGEPVVPGPEAKPTTRDPSGQKMAPCPTTPSTAQPGDETPTTPTKTAAPAVAVEAKPTFTG
jgi:CubicO group peptidase (beta-lactamase class C family)